jgi:uridine phosphorylase
MANEVLHHVQLRRGDVGRYVLLPGDPGRCELIAASFDDARLVAHNREYRTYTGTLVGEPVSVTSTGIGCPSTAIAVEELIACGADTFIRVGTSGGMQPDLTPGDLAIITGAIRDEGTTAHYMPAEFPAVADPEVVAALRAAAARTGCVAHCGIAHSKDSFYGQHQPQRMPVADHLIERWKAWRMGGAICSEMEAAAIFVLGSIYRVRTGGVMLIAANQERDEPVRTVVHHLHGVIATAVEALRILIDADRMPRRTV